MISYLLVSAFGISVVLSGYSHSLDQLEGEAGVWEVLTVLITTPEKSAQTLCAKDVDDTTISVFCSLSGYTEFMKVDSSTQTLDSDLTVGYSVQCSKQDLFKDCRVKEVSECTEPLVFKCTDHYTSLFRGVSTNDLILPAILIPILVLYVLALCILEFREKRENKVSREVSLKTTVAAAFEKTPSTKECQDV